MKVLDVTDLHSGIEQILEALKTHYSEIVQIEAAVKGFIALEDEFKGKGGEAIRGFYEETHIPLLSFYKSFLTDYQSRLEAMKSELYALEPVNNGYIAEQFLSDELRIGLKKVENETVTLTDEANQIIASVADIVVLPRLDDSEFLNHLNTANRHRKDTIEALNQFDYQQSMSIRLLQDDVLKMQQYVKEVKTLFKSGELQVDTFKSGSLKTHGIDELIKTDVEANSCSREELELAEQKRIEELKNKLITASSTEEYLKIANEIGFENLTEEQQQIVTNLEIAKQNIEIAKGMGVGLYDAGKDLVTGIWNLVTKPGETVEGVIQSVTHPVETSNYIIKSVVDSFVRDMINGDAYSRGHWVSYALASVIGAKGAGSVAKTGISTTKAVVQKGATAATNMIEAPDITKYLPYAPQHQMAFPGGVPYNVVNGEGLKEQLISMARVESKGTGNRDADIPPAFKQEEFASSYEARINQTPALINSKVEFEGIRGESLCTLKPPPDPKLKRILDEVGIEGIQYKNGVPDFSPVSKAQIEIDFMLGGKGSYGGKARTYNFAQADQKLADKLNESVELARQFGMEPGGITAKDIDKYRTINQLTWHEVNDVKIMQLVPTEINKRFGHLGGVGEINTGAFEPGGFANK